MPTKSEQIEESIRLRKTLIKRGSSDDSTKSDELSSPRRSNSELSVSSRDESFQSYSHSETAFGHMESYFIDNLLTDITLVAGDKRINAHKIVLCATSDYFAAMFLNDLREANQAEVTLQQTNGDILFKLVHYCYTGKIELHENTVESLLETASILQLDEVTKACCQFLKKQLHPSNCIGICIFADHQNCMDLRKAAHTYTTDCFMEVIQNQEFLGLPEDEIYKLLSSDDLNVPSEEEIFKALMKWVEHDEEERCLNIGKLLELVKLPLLDPSFIADQVQTHRLLANAECHALIVEALMYHALPERRSQLQTERTHPRKSTVGALYAVGGQDSSTKGSMAIERYDSRTDRWTYVGNMSSKRAQFGAAVRGSRMYIVGGREGLKTLNTVECLEMHTMSWSTLPQMSTHRHGLGVTFLEGPLYAVGGHDGWSYLNTVERWDPELRQWSYVAPMAMARSTAGVAVLNNKLYVVGGRDGSSCLRTVEQYDPHTNKWTLRASMVKRRGSVGVGVLNGYLYAVGGHDAPATNPSATRFECVERYDPKEDVWTLVANLSAGRDAVGIGILGDRLFSVGGYDGQFYLANVEMYDPVANEWKQVSSLNNGRAGACIVAIKDHIKEEKGENIPLSNYQSSRV